MTNPPIAPDTALETPAPTPGRSALWEDFIDIFHSPSAVFARRENGNVWIPIVVVTVLIGGLFLANAGILSSLMDAEFNRGAAAAMKKNPNITTDQLASMRHMQEMFAPVFVMVVIPIGIFITGLALWLMGKVVDATESLRTAVIVAAYAAMPKVLGTLAAGVQGLLMDASSFTSHYQLSLGPVRFLNPDTSSPLLLAILDRFDLFTIWSTVLLAIGLAVTGRIPRSRAAVAAAAVWVVGLLPNLLAALRS